MINGNPHEFIDRISTSQDTVFIYNNVKYWFQGYGLDEGGIYMEVFQVAPSSGELEWEYKGKSMIEGQDAFQNAPIFNGKTFWEVEKDIEWVDY